VETVVREEVTPALTIQRIAESNQVDEKATQVSEMETQTVQHAVNDEWRLLCNCYSYVKEVFESLPMTKTILSNISTDGEVAVFYYPSSGVHHYAVVVDRSDGKITIDETNYRTCQFSRRVIDENYPPLIGFYRV
jgi:hypothetical protein